MCIRDRTNIEGGSLQSYATAVGLLPGNPGTGVPDRIVVGAVSYTHLRAHETVLDLVCRLLLEKKKQHNIKHDHRCQGITKQLHH